LSNYKGSPVHFTTTTPSFMEGVYFCRDVHIEEIAGAALFER